MTSTALGGPAAPDDGPPPADLADHLFRHPHDPHRPLVGDLTADETRRRVGEHARTLREQGVRPGEAVGLHGPNDPDWVLALLALVRAGARPLLLPAESPPGEIRRLLGLAGATRHLDAARPGAELVTDGTPGAAPPGRGVPGTVLLTSSGSTGAPKVVARSQRSLLDEGYRYRRAGLVRPDDTVLAPVPLSHAYALGWLAGALVAGARVLPVPARAVGAVHARLLEGATVLLAVPGLARVWARRRALTEDAPYPALRLVMAGAGYVDDELDALWTRALGIGVSRNYGSTETGAVLWGHSGLPSGALDREMPGVRVDLLGPDGERLTGAGRGELAVLLEDGTRHPMHDVAERDDRGAYRVLGRKHRGVVRRGARWVSTLEVESVLRQAPGVADVRVMATGAEDSDDRGLVAEYVAADDTLAGPDRVMAFARSALASYKVPDRFEHRYRLRRSALGKAQADPVHHLRPAGRPRTGPAAVVAGALSALGLTGPLTEGATAAGLARDHGLRADVLPLLLDTACALGVLGTEPPTGHPAPADADADAAADAHAVPDARADAVAGPPSSEVLALAELVRRGPAAAPATGAPLPTEVRARVDGLLTAAAGAGRARESGDGSGWDGDGDDEPLADADRPAACLVTGVHGPSVRLGRLAALLRPGGLLVVADTFVADPRVLPDEHSRTTVVDWLVHGHLRRWTPQEMQAALEAVGLVWEATEAVPGTAHTLVTARKPA
ncbi:long-chain fatty acid--CoA ligase [Streptomyces dangxiongensis]|uniref:Long-chain fatty acid--CoA ligase n=1 Tax=Streptomyces dangxiongensis TaxID=1442032 RepID=A0A3G2JFB5_9ACTN|nr:class I adenylate-forming enzyme family protein [Streptomyces dangxiongensis]AYN40321.1 long-chain fatty acid--CoA ligase [Streptomyces dangxiongensis]